MPVKPEMLDKDFKLEIERRVSYIDTHLLEQTLPKGGGVIYIKMVIGLTKDHWHVLREIYKNIGWSDVTWTQNGEVVTLNFHYKS